MDDYFYYAYERVDNKKCKDVQGCQYNNGFNDVCCTSVSIIYNDSIKNNITLNRCFNT